MDTVTYPDPRVAAFIVGHFISSTAPSSDEPPNSAATASITSPGIRRATTVWPPARPCGPRSPPCVGRGPARIVVAVPVGAPETCAEFQTAPLKYVVNWNVDSV